jgi:hypothetical protein
VVGGSVIIVIELDEKEDPVTSIGQSTTEDLFPEISKLVTWRQKLRGSAYRRIFPYAYISHTA